MALLYCCIRLSLDEGLELNSNEHKSVQFAVYEYSESHHRGVISKVGWIFPPSHTLLTSLPNATEKAPSGLRLEPPPAIERPDCFLL